MRTQQHMGIWSVGLALLLVGWLASPALGQPDTPASRSVIATVTAVHANAATVTLQTAEGEVFAVSQLHQWSQWTQGDKLLCNRLGGGRPRLQGCQLWQDAGTDAFAQQERPGVSR